jgi:predicted transcriptional regulator
MVNLPKLKGKMVECDVSQDQMAKELDVSRSTLIRKMAGGGLGFTVGDVKRIIEILSLTKDEVVAIFFTESVA